MTIYRHLALEDVLPHPGNVRKDLGDLADLTASVKAQGVLQPIVVAPVTIDGTPTGHHVIVAGHRRHAAAQQAGHTLIPAVIRDDLDTDAKVLTAMLTENLARRDLTLMEEADAYHQLELLGVKDTAIAKAVGRTPRTIKDRRLIACLPTARREQLETGKLTLDAATKCARLRAKHIDDPEILQIIDTASHWKFAPGAWGIDQDIKAALHERQRAADLADAKDDTQDEDPAEDPITPGQTTVDQHIRDQERAARRDRLTALWNRQSTWLTEQLPGLLGPGTWLTALALAIVEDAFTAGPIDPQVLDYLGIDYTADDTGTITDWTITDKQALAIILFADPLGVGPELLPDPQPWQLDEDEIRRRAQILAAIGYQPGTDELPADA